ncbi:uncharacterized protein LOC134211593 isoform X3 [Armigeres subalbatus]|uniref:uncharacterized protein LOC134211593 isoform X3 n=1 Tax=Armigeres subalbatus TaxID=124917 RepID=UPI002ED439F5
MEKSLFNGLGCIKGFVYDIDLVENPVFRNDPPRRIPHALRSNVKEELDSMLKMGVIEPITEPTPILNAMVIVRQKASNVVLKPRIVNQVTESLKQKRLQQKEYADRSTVKPKEYQVGQPVMLKDMKSGLWRDGKIMERLEHPRSYMVQLGDGKVLRRNVRDIREKKTLHDVDNNRVQYYSQIQPAINFRGDLHADLHLEGDPQPIILPADPMALPASQSVSTATSTRTRSGREVRAKRDDNFEYY